MLKHTKNRVKKTTENKITIQQCLLTTHVLNFAALCSVPCLCAPSIREHVSVGALRPSGQVRHRLAKNQGNARAT